MKKKATVICWISTALAALALCLTCGLPLPAGIPPMLLQWLILPLLALLTAAVQAGRLLAGLRAALAGKPDGRLFCLLAAIGALALAALGKGGSSAAAAALLLCADAWLEQLQARVDGELPGTRLSSAGARLWFWGFLLAAVCAAVVWGILGAAADEIVCRAVGILAVGALCPFSLTAACTVRRAVRICRVPVLDAQAVPALGDTDIVLLEPEGLLTGAPSVSDIRPAGMEEGQFLALAASILQGSGDGQAACIRALAEDRGLALRPAAQADAAGAVIDGKHYLAGTAEQLRRAGIPVPRADELALSGKSAALLRHGGRTVSRADRPAVPDLRGRAGNCTGALGAGAFRRSSGRAGAAADPPAGGADRRVHCGAGGGSGGMAGAQKAGKTRAAARRRASVRSWRSRGRS